MDDSRAALYDRYVSGFKAADPPMSDVSRRLYWAWCEHKYLPLLDKLARDEPILELGCGAGNLLEFFTRQGFSHARGVDISPEQVALGRMRGLPVEAGSAFEWLPAQGGGSAAIIAVDFLEHLTREELLRLAPLLREALRPGGHLLVQTANGHGLFPGQVIYGDLTHLTIFTPQSLAQLLRPFGFVDFRFSETGPVPMGLKGRLDTALWSAIKFGANMVRRVESGKTQSIWTENFICRATRTA